MFRGNFAFFVWPKRVFCKLEFLGVILISFCIVLRLTIFFFWFIICISIIGSRCLGGTLPDAILLLLESEIWLPDLGNYYNGGNYYTELLTFIDLLVWELLRLCYIDSTLSSSSFDFCYRWLIWVDKIRSFVTRGLRESEDFMLNLRFFGLKGFLVAYDIIGL